MLAHYQLSCSLDHAQRRQTTSGKKPAGDESGGLLRFDQKAVAIRETFSRLSDDIATGLTVRYRLNRLAWRAMPNALEDGAAALC